MLVLRVCSLAAGLALGALALAQERVDSPEPVAERPAKGVLKDAQLVPGYFNLYRKDDDVWLHIQPEQFEQPFFFTFNIPQSVGERGLYAGAMGQSFIAVFRKVGNQVQLIAQNTDFAAQPQTPQAKWVADGFSESLLASAPQVAAAEANVKGSLIKLNQLLLADIANYGRALEQAYNIGFSLDARNSHIQRVDATPELSGVRLKAHFQAAKSVPTLSRNTPDARSLFVSFYYSFMKLPDNPMPPRMADERLGHFYTDPRRYDTDLAVNPVQRLIWRWRLEKKDPDATVSDPKQPIVYWIDSSVPEQYRQAVRDGVLRWNAAFERIGFSNAIVVKQQTDADTFDTMDARHASIRWSVTADRHHAGAVGPSHVDPRTGEILDADIVFFEATTRNTRRFLRDRVDAPLSSMACAYSTHIGAQFDLAVGLLEARGELGDSSRVESLTQALVADVIAHEVGHTLGLRHNFRASMAYSLKQVQDPAFTRVHGMSGSVMDYNPWNLALKGEPQGEYLMSTLGPYDYLAIEYAYKPLPVALEQDELNRLAAQTQTQAGLAYASDDDVRYDIDPEVNRHDLGSDPMAYAKKRIKLVQEMWTRLQDGKPRPDHSYERQTRAWLSGLDAYGEAAMSLTKYVAGVKRSRDRATSKTPVYQPTPLTLQREALRLLTQHVFSEANFQFKPELVARLTIDPFDSAAAADFQILQLITGLQKSVLDTLLSDTKAQRLLESETKTTAAALKLSEVYETLEAAIWSELKSADNIRSARRSLQREYIARLTQVLTRPVSRSTSDVRAVTRIQARKLLSALHGVRTKHLNPETQAHLEEAATTLSEALKAPLVRTGV